MHLPNSLRNRKTALRIVQELDAFPKVAESYQETTATGGSLSVAVFIIIVVLIISEVRYYSARQLKFDYDVDPHFEGKLQLNIDLTVAMKCANIGADILDLTGQTAESFGQLAEEDTFFELTPTQRNHFSVAQRMNNYFRQEYHALYDFLWSAQYDSRSSGMPAREILSSEKPDACRLHGSLTVNKVAGNFHITAGKIVHLSFGHSSGGIINPLDGEEKTTLDHNHMFQYFLQIVPTKVESHFSTLDTYQYAATESNRTISHDKGSHGLPGIFFKYDLSSLRVHISETRQPFWQFLARLCGIIGGIFATSGILNNLVGAFVDLLCCRLRPKLGKSRNALVDSGPVIN